jgi:hypothetical protein
MMRTHTNLELPVLRGALPVLLAVLAAALVPLCLRAEVVDRILAVVDGHVITLSDVRQERQVRAVLGEKPVSDDLAVAQELADEYLIEQQIKDYPNLNVDDAEVDEEVVKFLDKEREASPALRQAVRRRIRAQKFFDLKFGEIIRPTDEQIRHYYSEVFVPEARNRGLDPVPPLNDSEMTKAIRENVIRENLDHEVDVWLQAIRRRSTIELFK